MKLLPYILSENDIYISALEMASPGNQHCASCIGTLSDKIYGSNFMKQRSKTVMV